MNSRETIVINYHVSEVGPSQRLPIHCEWKLPRSVPGVNSESDVHILLLGIKTRERAVRHQAELLGVLADNAGGEKACESLPLLR